MKKVLFVCLGNICRSPAAEAVFKEMVRANGLDKSLFIDSAGTGAYHVGEKADPRMREHGMNRGYDLTSIARQFVVSDFTEFDYILAMDDANYSDIMKLDPKGEYKNKVHRMVSFCKVHDVNGVPDPYHGGADGFELVLDILEDSCSELLKKISRELKTS